MNLDIIIIGAFKTLFFKPALFENFDRTQLRFLEPLNHCLNQEPALFYASQNFLLE